LGLCRLFGFAMLYSSELAFSVRNTKASFGIFLKLLHIDVVMVVYSYIMCNVTAGLRAMWSADYRPTCYDDITVTAGT